MRKKRALILRRQARVLATAPEAEELGLSVKTIHRKLKQLYKRGEL